DLLDAGRLLARGGGDLGDDVGDLLHRRHDLLERLAGLGDEHRAVLDFTHRVLDELLYLLGRGGGAAREAANFARHYREAPALLAGAGRLDGGIQREEVRLE